MALTKTHRRTLDRLEAVKAGKVDRTPTWLQIKQLIVGLGGEVEDLSGRYHFRAWLMEQGGERKRVAILGGPKSKQWPSRIEIEAVIDFFEMTGHI